MSANPHRASATWFNRFLLAAFAIAAGLMAGLIVKSFVMPSIMARAIEGFTDLEPLTPPASPLTDSERAALHDRVDAYVDRVKDRLSDTPEILELSTDALNALIQDDLDDDTEWRAHVRIDDNLIRAEVSYYLGPDVATGALSRFAGRYIRGEASMTISLENARIVARIHSLEVKDKTLPHWMLERLLGDNAVIDLSEDPDTQAFARNLDRIEIRDNKILLISRASS